MPPPAMSYNTRSAGQSSSNGEESTQPPEPLTFPPNPTLQETIPPNPTSQESATSISPVTSDLTQLKILESIEKLFTSMAHMSANIQATNAQVANLQSTANLQTANTQAVNTQTANVQTANTQPTSSEIERQAATLTDVTPVITSGIGE
ncbi:hypothetical protein I314_04621 [Cryptococcus bacillisporus CA1873]|uniref:Uncharacterized protein n=1 Tax=Cryptococcus bacillisporus CA1873 TaxID=1296111 RepID=A0ABR5B7R8_CRYGA|nr:hypothetical protein I314_04621 [Cryptococcus bacillisporus CA1873]|eukprot:KIR59626.1 hypothetical protein I314_04621 [Cryptococcus gattii CA1873]